MTTAIVDSQAEQHPTPQPASDPKPLLVSSKRAAALCGVSKAMWYRALAAGKIPSPVRIGRCVRWRVEELHAWVEAGCPNHQVWEAMKQSETNRRRRFHRS